MAQSPSDLGCSCLGSCSCKLAACSLPFVASLPRCACASLKSQEAGSNDFIAAIWAVGVHPDPLFWRSSAAGVMSHYCFRRGFIALAAVAAAAEVCWHFGHICRLRGIRGLMHLVAKLRLGFPAPRCVRNTLIGIWLEHDSRNNCLWPAVLPKSSHHRSPEEDISVMGSR